MSSVPMPEPRPKEPPAKAPVPALSHGTGRAEKEKKAAAVLKPIQYPFWFGGTASSMAACVTHPLDLGTSHLVF